MDIRCARVKLANGRMDATWLHSTPKSTSNQDRTLNQLPEVATVHVLCHVHRPFFYSCYSCFLPTSYIHCLWFVQI